MKQGIRRYVFDKKKLNEYHQNNQEAFKQALENRIDIVKQTIHRYGQRIWL